MLMRKDIREQLYLGENPERPFGVKAAPDSPKANFRFALDSGLNSDIAACPFRANKRLVHRSKSTSLFDHLVGAQQQRCRQFETECLGQS